MSIIVSEKGMNARKIDPTSIAAEDYLQTYIKNNPKSIPVHEIRQDLAFRYLHASFRQQVDP